MILDNATGKKTKFLPAKIALGLISEELQWLLLSCINMFVNLKLSYFYYLSFNEYRVLHWHLFKEFPGVLSAPTLTN
jgi:hypothetical protein